MPGHKLHCSVQNFYHILNAIKQFPDDVRFSCIQQAIDITNEFIDILYSLAECQPHQFSGLKLRAKKLINRLEE